MSRILLLLLLSSQFLLATFSGIITPGIVLKQNLDTTVSHTVSANLLMILRYNDFAFEGNRLSYNLGSVLNTTIAPVIKIEQEDKIIESGLQLTHKIAFDHFIQLNTFFDTSNTHSGYQIELMLFKRFNPNNKLFLLPSLALQYDNADRFSYLYDVSQNSLNLEFELLTIYDITPSWNLASTFFVNYYDEKILTNLTFDRQLIYRLSLGLGYTF